MKNKIFKIIINCVGAGIGVLVGAKVGGLVGAIIGASSTVALTIVFIEPILGWLNLNESENMKETRKIAYNLCKRKLSMRGMAIDGTDITEDFESRKFTKNHKNELKDILKKSDVEISEKKKLKYLATLAVNLVLNDNFWGKSLEPQEKHKIIDLVNKLTFRDLSIISYLGNMRPISPLDPLPFNGADGDSDSWRWNPIKYIMWHPEDIEGADDDKLLFNNTLTSLSDKDLIEIHDFRKNVRQRLQNEMEKYSRDKNDVSWGVYYSKINKIKSHSVGLKLGKLGELVYEKIDLYNMEREDILSVLTLINDIEIDMKTGVGTAFK